MWKSLVSDATERRVIHSIRETPKADSEKEIRRLIYQSEGAFPTYA